MTDFAALRTMMVDGQIRPSDVTRYPIIEAMLEVPRELYVPPERRAVAYAGEAIALAPGRVILDPRVFGKLLDALEVGAGDFVLDIGCGLGYSAAVLARLAEAVVAIEEIPGMAEEAAATLAAEAADNAVATEAPLTAGDPAHGPYDVIVIEGGVGALPETLPVQLKEGGRIGAIFVSGGTGRARVGVRTDGEIAWRDAFDATAPVLPGFEVETGFVF